MDLVNRLRRFGGPTLRGLAGETLLKAVQACAPTNLEKELAEVLLLRFGKKLLEEREIRKSLIDTLSEKECSDLAGITMVAGATPIEQSINLLDYFSSYSKEKSLQLVSFLSLDPEYALSPVRETRSATELISVEHGAEVKLKGYLHDYQKALKDQINIYCVKSGSRFLVQMPTGSGKTYTSLEAVVDIFRAPQHKSFVVWLVDSNELAEQAFESFRFLWKTKGDHSLTFARIFGPFFPDFRKLTDGGIVFASFDKFHSALSNRESANHASIRHLIANTDLLVVDEAHGSVASTYGNCIEAFIRTDKTTVFGLTATPGRASPQETAELTEVFSKNLITLKDENGKALDDPIHYLQEHKFLAKLNVLLLETGVTVAEADEKRICKQLAMNSIRNQNILEQMEIAEKAEQTTLTFACTLDHVFALKVMAQTRGIPVELIVGATPPTERLRILKDFTERKFFNLINLDILSTGIDIPKIQRLIITRPIGSPILYSQILGRALRGEKNGGNAENTVVNLRDNLLNFPSANLLYTHFWEEWGQKL